MTDLAFLVFCVTMSVAAVLISLLASWALWVVLGDWRKPLFVLAFALLVAMPASAQSSLLTEVISARSRYPASMTAAQVGEMLNAVAWAHRAEGWGLLRKGAGNSCPLAGTFISCDILIHA